MVLRRAAELLARRSRFTKRLPAEFGARPVYVSGANQLAVFKFGGKGFDRMLLDWAIMLVKPGMQVWDVGANMGFFSFPAAARGAAVVGFEPDPFNQDLLHRTCALNRDLDVRVIPAAVAQSLAIASFNIAERGRSTNRLSHVAQGTQTGGIRQKYDVLTITLDWAMERLPAPALIKIDAEGAELEVLRGAARLLAEVQPAMIIEIEPENAAGVWSIMLAAGYVCFDGGAPGFPCCESLDGVWNALFVHADRIGEFTALA